MFNSNFNFIIRPATGSFIMNVIFHTLSGDIEGAPCGLELVLKVGYICDILIFGA